MNGKTKPWYIVLPFLSIAIVLGAWTMAALPENSLFPSIPETLKRFGEICVQPLSGATLFGHILASLRRVLSAYLLACVLGITLGVAFGWFRTFDYIVGPVFNLLRSIPAIAWIPLAILWFGIGEVPKLYIIFIGSFVPVVINTMAGVKSVDGMLIDAGKALGANNNQLLTDVAFPAATPAILAGIRTGLSTAWLCVLAAEMIVSKEGIGFLIINGQNNNDMAIIVACMIVIAVVNAILSTLLMKLEGVLCPWMFDEKK